MKNNLFDQINEQLKGYESPVDFNAEWDALYPKYKAKSRRKLRIVLWFSVIALMVFSSLLYLKLGNDNQFVINNKLDFTQNHKSNAGKSLGDDELTTNVNDKIETILNEQSQKKKTLENTSIENKRIESVNGSNYIAHNTMSFLKSEVETKALQESNMDSKIYKSENINNAKTIGLLSYVTPIEQRNINIVTDEKMFHNLAPQTLFDNEEEENEEQNNIRLFINAGLGQTTQSLMSKNNDADEFLILRKSQEKPLETYIYSIGLDYRLNANSYLILSLHYNTAFDNIAHSYLRPKEYSFTDIPLRRIINQNTGEIIETVIGDTIVMGTQSVELNKYNTYKSFSARFEYGYTFINNAKFQLGLTCGIQYNIHFAADGSVRSYFDPEGPLVDIDHLRKSIGFGILGGLDFDYMLSENLSLNVRPVGQLGLSNSALDEYQLSSKFNLLSFSLGIKYKL